jgi:RNA polymerase sigma factor (sigma-70 family)
LTYPGRGNRLADWFREWRWPLRRYLARRRSIASADIEDIAQEVFLRLLRYDRTELIKSPQSYLFQIAANVSAEWSARASRSRPHHSEWLDNVIDAHDPEEQMLRSSTDEQIAHAVKALPARSREILRLHFSEELSHEKIASQLGVTRRIVKRDIAAAYASLRVALEPELAQASAGKARGAT